MTRATLARWLRRIGVLAWASAMLSGCGPGARGASTADDLGRHSRDASAAGAEPAGPSAGNLLAHVPPGTFGPYVGVAGDQRVLVWATAPDEGAGAWWTLPVDGRGHAVGEPLRIGPAPEALDLVGIEPAHRDGAAGAAKGFVVVFTTRGDPGDRLGALMLGPRGELLQTFSDLAAAGSDIMWIDSVPTPEGALVFWAQRNQSAADVLAMRLGDSERDPKATPIAEGVRAWQVAWVPTGAALATVGPQRNGAAQGSVELFFVSAAGEPSKPITVSGAASAEPEIDLCRWNDRLVVAWVDRRDIDAHVYLAGVDLTGRASEPRRATAPRGDQALLQLVPSRNSAPRLVWENLLDRSDGVRHFRVAEVRPSLEVAEHQALVTTSESGRLPEFAAADSRLAVLGSVERCASAEAAENPAPRCHVVPALAELDENLTPRAWAPVLAAPEHPALVAWDLSCGADSCFALGVGSGSPAPLVAQPLPRRQIEGYAFASPEPGSVAPKLSGLHALADIEPLADLDAVSTLGGTLLASVTYFDPAIPYERPKSPAPDGRYAPVRALLRTHALAGTRLAAPQVISYRARSLGGVSLASANEKEHLLVWTAIENGSPQVFATLLDAAGNKLRQRMITRGAGEVSDVVAARSADGWVVGWVDERDGDPEVYATRLDAQLATRVPEQRITRAPGVATGLFALIRGGAVWLVWADARGADQTRHADIMLARLDGVSLKLVAPPRALADTEAHSHSPTLAALGDGALVAWVEQNGTDSLADESSSIALARLDATGQLIQGPEALDLGEHNPSRIALDCGDAACRGLATVAEGDDSAVLALEWSASGARYRRVTGLAGPAGAVVGPLLLGSNAFLADSATDPSRLRRLELVWP